MILTAFYDNFKKIFKISYSLLFYYYANWFITITYGR